MSDDIFSDFESKVKSDGAGKPDREKPKKENTFDEQNLSEEEKIKQKYHEEKEALKEKYQDKLVRLQEKKASGNPVSAASRITNAERIAYISLIAILLIAAIYFGFFRGSEQAAYSSDSSENEQLKKTLSSELHDNIGQLLILVKLKLANMEKHHASEIELDVDSVYHKIREISKNLRPLEFKDERLKMAMQTLVQTVSLNSQIDGSFDFLGEDVVTDPKIGLCIYRVVQEALNNIMKHSRATEFSVQIGNYSDKINVVVSDNGIGIPNEYYSSKEFKNYGTGLFSMKERIENLGGNIKINSFPQEGTTLFIEFYKRG